MDRLLEKLINGFGVSGHEEQIRKIISEEVKNIGYDAVEDKMGNLIVKVGQGDEKLMLCAHMDQIGVIVTFIEDNGYVRIGNIGDYKAADVVHNYIRFENGVTGKVGAAKENPEFGDLFVDLGLSSREKVLEKIKEGDVANFIGSCLEPEGYILGPNLDNRIGCYVFLQLLKEIKNVNKEDYFVFSAQQQLEGRGARAAAYRINPDSCMVVDMQESGDAAGKNGNIKLGEGPVLSIMNKTLIINHRIKAMLEEAAVKAGVKLQYGVSSENTDGGMIHKERGGIMTGVISIPCRYKHSVSEMVSLKDIDSQIKVLRTVLEV